MSSLRTRLGSACALALCVAAAPLRADDDAGKAVYRQTLKATAFIATTDFNSWGTGWVVDKDRRLLVTNHHVVHANDDMMVLFPQFNKNGKVIAEKKRYMKEAAIRGVVLDSDPLHDLALIQVDSLPDGVTELELAGDDADPGDRLHSVGNPAASDALWVYSTGKVRAVYRRSWSTRTASGSIRRWSSRTRRSTPATAAAQSSAMTASWSALFRASTATPGWSASASPSAR